MALLRVAEFEPAESPLMRENIPSPIAQATALPQSHRGATDNIRGIIWALISVIGASAMTLAVRGVALQLDSRMVVMGRGAITSLIVLVALLLIPRLRRQLSFTRPWAHLWRGLIVGVSTNLGFYTLATIPLATATVLFFTAPIFATILSVFVHGEKVGPRRILAAVAGFTGALVILRPGFEAFQPGMLTALGSSALFAIALTQSRGLANADGAFSTYFSSVFLTVLVTLPLALPVWQLPSDGVTWFAVAMVVIASAIRGIADIEAYRYGDAAILGPISYLRLVLIGAGAWLMFSEGFDAATWIGAAIIIAATLYIARREASLRKRKPKT